MMVAALSNASRFAACFAKIVSSCPSTNCCRCFGIEIMKNPASYAENMLSRSVSFIHSSALPQFCKPLVLIYCIRLQAIAKKNGVTHAPIELLHGDFLECNAVKTAMASAGVVYMNNPRFGAELNLKVLGMHLLCQYTIKVADSFQTEQLCTFMPKGSKLICFESLIATRSTSRHNNGAVLRFKKFIKVIHEALAQHICNNFSRQSAGW